MAYRGGIAGEVIVVHSGLLAPWRGLVAATLCAGAAGSSLDAHGLMGFALWLPMGAMSLFALASTVRRARWITVTLHPRTGVVVARERGLEGIDEREVQVMPEDTLRVDVEHDETWLGQLPALPLERSTVMRAGAEGETAISSRLTGVKTSRAIATRLAHTLSLAPVRSNCPLGPRGWPDVRTYVMLACALTLITIVGMAFERVNTARTGQLELVCTERCLFDGMECLPGGSMSGRFDPGERVIRVIDPDAPDGMREVRAPIAVGHRTVFECRADAASPTPVPEDP